MDDAQKDRVLEDSLPSRVAVGRITRPWGLHGEFKVELSTDFPDRFQPMAKFVIKGSEYTCAHVRHVANGLVLKLEGVDDRDQADQLRDASIEIDSVDVKVLPPGVYYHHEIIGLDVWTTTGQFLGVVQEILHTASNDIYVIHGASGEVLVPATNDVISSIHLDKGYIMVDSIPGLL